MLRDILLFYPDETIEPSRGWPPAESVPEGTWACVVDTRDDWDPGISRWSQVVKYTRPWSVGWEYYSLNAPELIHLTKHMKMLALVMP